MKAVGRGGRNGMTEKFILIGGGSAEKIQFFLYRVISACRFINCNDVNLGQLGHPLLEREQGGGDYFS